MNRAVAYFASGIGNLAMMMPALQALHDLSGEPVDIFIPDGWKDPRKDIVEEILRMWSKAGDVIHWPGDNFKEANYKYWFRSEWSDSNEGAQFFEKNMSHKRIPRPNWTDSLEHETDHYMDIVYSMGYRGSIPKVDFPTSGDLVLELEHPIIAFSNGALKNKFWLKKYWPYFSVLSEMLKYYLGSTIVGIGGSDELNGVSMDLDFTGKISITQTARVLSQVDILVANDTGNEKIADVMRIPIVAIFGPTLISKVGPRNGKSIAIGASIPCAPCQGTEKFKTCEDNKCMRSISVGDVMACIKSLINKRF